MPHDPRAVANQFIERADAHKKLSNSDTFFVNALELQKLVIIAHGFHYLVYRKHLVSEGLSLGQFEPTFDTLAEALTIYGDGPVTAEISAGSPYEVFFHSEEPVRSLLSPDEKTTVEAIWNLFVTYKPRCEILSVLTRGNQAEWEAERKKYTEMCAEFYPVEALANRLASKMDKNNDDLAA